MGWARSPCIGKLFPGGTIGKGREREREKGKGKGKGKGLHCMGGEESRIVYLSFTIVYSNLTNTIPYSMS